MMSLTTEKVQKYFIGKEKLNKQLKEIVTSEEFKKYCEEKLEKEILENIKKRGLNIHVPITNRNQLEVSIMKCSLELAFEYALETGKELEESVKEILDMKLAKHIVDCYKNETIKRVSCHENFEKYFKQEKVLV